MLVSEKLEKNLKPRLPARDGKSRNKGLLKHY